MKALFSDVRQLWPYAESLIGLLSRSPPPENTRGIEHVLLTTSQCVMLSWLLQCLTLLGHPAVQEVNCTVFSVDTIVHT